MDALNRFTTVTHSRRQNKHNHKFAGLSRSVPQYGRGIDLTRAWAGILKYSFFISNLNFTRYQWIHLVNFNVSSTLENYFEACKTFQYLQNFKKGIMDLQAIQDTSKNHRKLFWSLQDIPVLAKLQKRYNGPSSNPGYF